MRRVAALVGTSGTCLRDCGRGVAEQCTGAFVVPRGGTGEAVVVFAPPLLSYSAVALDPAAIV